MKNIFILVFLTIYSLSAWSSSLRDLRRIPESNVTRIENISVPEELEGSNTLIIGHRYWQIINPGKNIFPLPKQLNDLIRCYHYESNFEDKEYQGEVYLRIYDLENEESEHVSREQLYKEISHSFLNLKDSIGTWKKTNSFKPFPAFEYSYLDFITQEEDSSYKSHNFELKVILANDRAYFFIFCSKDLEPNDKFDKSCITLIKDIDIESFYKEEQIKKQEEKQEELEKREQSKRNMVEGSIVLICGLFVFILSSWNVKRNNKYARRWAIYSIILFAIGFLAMATDLLIRPSHDDTIGWLWLCFVPSVILDSIIVWYLKKLSSQEYQDYYLIPKYIERSRFFQLNSNYKKRIFMVVLIYPFFILVPIPIVGLIIVICYIIPINIIIKAIQGIRNIYLWIKEGKAIDNEKE